MALSPVVWVEQLNRFLVVGYDECHEVENDQERFTARTTDKNMIWALGGRPMNRRDDPDHAADRKAINPFLRPKNVRNTFGSKYQENAEKYIQRLLDVGPENADLNRDYAAPVASQNLIHILGFKDVSVE